MRIPTEPAFWILIVAAGFAVSLCAYSLTHREHRSSLWIVATTLALLLWIVGYAIEIASVTMESMLFWANIQFIGIGAVPLLWYSTVRVMFGRKPVPLRVAIPASIIPIVTIVLVYTDPFHGLFRMNPDVVRQAGMILLRPNYGLWHNAVFVPYQYVLYLVTLGVVVTEWVRSSAAYRGRYPVLLTTTLLPMVGATLYIVGVPPLQYFNPTSILILVSFVLFVLVVTRHRAMDLVPIARERIVDTLSEAVVVLDRIGTIVDYNPSAAALFPELEPEAFGSSFADVMTAYPQLQLLAMGVERDETGFEMEKQGVSRYCLARASEITGLDGSPIGVCISVTDITAQVSLIQSEASKETDHGRVRSPHAFIAYARAELDRAAYLGFAFHIVVVDGGGAPFNEEQLNKRLERSLEKYEVGARLSEGRYAFVIPGRDREGVATRTAAVQSICASFMEHVTTGTAGRRDGDQIERLIQDAIRRLR